MVERFSAECRCRVRTKRARILGSASLVTTRGSKMRLPDPTARRRRRDSEPVMMSMSRMCTEKQLVCSESQSESPQGQISEPSITAQISDMLQQSSTRIWQNPSGYFTEEAPMRKQRGKESLQGDNVRSWLAGATASLGGAYNDIVHMGRGATANQQDTNSRSRTSPTTQVENTLRFRCMQVFFWLHRLKVVCCPAAWSSGTPEWS